MLCFMSAIYCSGGSEMTLALLLVYIYDAYQIQSLPVLFIKFVQDMIYS